MPSTLEISQKINSLSNMQKVTRAMNMIASIRLRKLLSRLEALSVFEKSLQELLRVAVPVLAWEPHPLVAGYKDVSHVHVIVFAADRGLCGSHNNAVNKGLERLSAKVRSQGSTVELTCIGTKGNNYARRKGYKVVYQSESNEQVLGDEGLRILADKIFRRFLDGEIHEVYVIYNQFVSKIRQETQRRLVLPFPSEKKTDEADRPASPAVDLPPEQLLEEGGGLLFRYLLASALAHSSLSEQASRMTAMENASKNAQDLTAFYRKARNRARQTNITNELIEIISGKEAMKR